MIEWIPCSERMPEEPFGCIISVHTDHPYCGEGDIVYGVYGWDGETWNDSDGNPVEWTRFEEVTAWMPLPEPYDPLKGAMNPPEGEEE